jgi:RimJ/RimL family protein N-acetyltransferase
MTPDGFQVRPITPEELDAWWKLRLNGLRDHPDAFGGDYEASLKRGPGNYASFTTEGNVDRLFGAFTPAGELVSQAAVYGNDGKRRHVATIIAVHTDARWRGRGLSQALIRLAIDHCRSFPEIRQVTISANARNAAAIAVYAGTGFIPWGTEPRAIATTDGFHDEMHMVLMLDQ